jgi:hypothetical protein
MVAATDLAQYKSKLRRQLLQKSEKEERGEGKGIIKGKGEENLNNIDQDGEIEYKVAVNDLSPSSYLGIPSLSPTDVLAKASMTLGLPVHATALGPKHATGSTPSRNSSGGRAESAARGVLFPLFSGRGRQFREEDIRNTGFRDSSAKDINGRTQRNDCYGTGPSLGV